MEILNKILDRLGYIRKDYIFRHLQFARSIGKRLDEHRELVEAIEQKTTLFNDFWHIGHMATQDDYLMRLYYLVYGSWPEDGRGRQKTGEYVRSRPKILGPCELPEYVSAMGKLVKAPAVRGKIPFDPSIVAFRDEQGKEYRYINSPLDEVYIAEPGDSYLEGTLPPEEIEIWETLVSLTAFRRNVSFFSFWWSQLVRPTQDFLLANEYLQKLTQLSNRSREHRAAIHRMSNSKHLDQNVRQELKRILNLKQSTNSTLISESKIK